MKQTYACFISHDIAIRKRQDYQVLKIQVLQGKINKNDEVCTVDDLEQTENSVEGKNQEFP